MAIVKVTEKGQMTLPVDLRRKLRISKDDYLEVEAEGNVLKIRKVEAKKLLASDDPIWELIGRSGSGEKHGSALHDQYLAEAERKRWRKR
jgi:AbrB family looped-hinge helix DNA binding protein